MPKNKCYNLYCRGITKNPVHRRSESFLIVLDFIFVMRGACMDPIFGVRMEDVCHVVFKYIYVIKSILNNRPETHSEVQGYPSGYV